MIYRVTNGHYYELDVIIILLYLPTLVDFNLSRDDGGDNADGVVLLC